MKFILILFFSSIMLLSSEIIKDLNIDELKGDFLYKVEKENLPIGFITTDDEVKRKIDKDIAYASLYLKEMEKSEVEQLKYVMLVYLSRKEQEKIVKSASNEVTKDVALSYYVANKKEFYFARTVDIVTVSFKDKKEAQKFKINDTLPKNSQMQSYNDVEYKVMFPAYLMHLDHLKPNELSEVISYRDRYMRVYYKENKPEGYMTFEKAYPLIKNILLGKKSAKLLNNALKKAGYEGK